MELKKFYIGFCIAEQSSYFIISLTEEELKAVQKFCRAQFNICEGGGYCGSFGIFDTGYDTEAEAKTKAKEIW